MLNVQLNEKTAAIKPVKEKQFRLLCRILAITLIISFGLFYRFFSNHTLGSFLVCGVVCVITWYVLISMLGYLFRNDLAFEGGIGLIIAVTLLQGLPISILYTIWTSVIWVVTGNKLPPFVG